MRCNGKESKQTVPIAQTGPMVLPLLSLQLTVPDASDKSQQCPRRVASEARILFTADFVTCMKKKFLNVVWPEGVRKQEQALLAKVESLQI